MKTREINDDSFLKTAMKAARKFIKTLPPRTFIHSPQLKTAAHTGYTCGFREGYRAAYLEQQILGRD